MKRSILLIACIVLTAAFLRADKGTPRLTITKTTINFGEVIRGDVVEGDFILENKGDGDLLISEARPSCGCTITKFDRTIGPAKSGKVHARLDTRDFNGPITKNITVESNDPVMPYLKLFLKATIKSLVNVLPNQSVRFTKLEAEKITKSVTIVTQSAGNDFKAYDPEVDKPYLKAEIKLLPDAERDPFFPNRQYRMTISILPEAPVGTINAVVAVKTSEKRVPVLKVRLLGLVRPAVMVSPPVLTTGPVTNAADFQRSLLVVDGSETPQLKVLNVSSDIDFFNFEIEEMAPNKQYKVKVTLKEGVHPGPFSGTITITCDYPEARYRTLTVPVRGEIKK